MRRATQTVFGAGRAARGSCSWANSRGIRKTAPVSRSWARRENCSPPLSRRRASTARATYVTNAVKHFKWKPSARARQAPYPRKAQPRRGLRLPPVAARRDRGGRPRGHRLPGRHRRAEPAGTELPGDASARRACRVGNRAPRRGHRAPVIDPARPRRRRAPARDGAVHRRPAGRTRADLRTGAALAALTLPPAGAALDANTRWRGATNRQDSASSVSSSARRTRDSCTCVQPLRPHAPGAGENTFGFASRTIAWTSYGQLQRAVRAITRQAREDFAAHAKVRLLEVRLLLDGRQRQRQRPHLRSIAHTPSLTPAARTRVPARRYRAATRSAPASRGSRSPLACARAGRRPSTPPLPDRPSSSTADSQATTPRCARARSAGRRCRAAPVPDDACSA